MSFGSPLNFLWLLPVCGGIIALWMLRVRRKEQVVSSLYLWQRVTPTAKADTPLQRLRHSLLLFLQLLAAFLLVLATTHPLLLAAKSSGTRYVLIVDASASLSATDVAPNRLAVSIGKAQQFATTSLKPNDSADLIVSAGAPRQVVAWTSNSSRIRSALDSITPTDIGRDLPSAVTLARTEIGKRRADARIVIFSDGAWSTDDDANIRRAAAGIPVAIVATASSASKNVGITGMDSRRDAFGSNERQVFVRVRNFGSQAVSGKIEVTVNGSASLAQPVTLAAGASTDDTFTSSALTGGGVAEAKLTGFGQDDLASDNTATLELPSSRRMRILLVTTGNLFLEKGLALDPNVDLFETTPSDYPTIRARYDLQVFDDFAPASLLPGSYLVFHAVGGGMPVTSTGADSDTPAIIDWRETDPLMRFVDMTDVHFAAAAHVQQANWGQVVVDGSQGPLVVSGERFGRRCVWVAARTSDGDFPLKVAFPIFLTNAAQWLTDSSGSSGVLRPGAPILLPVGSGDWHVRAPGEEPHVFSCGSDAAVPCVYADVERVGIYRFTGKSAQMQYTANVESDVSSDIGPRDHPGFSEAAAAGPARAASRERNDIWTTVAIAVLCLILAEWLVYHRRA